MEENSKIDLIPNVTVAEFRGKGKLQTVVLERTRVVNCERRIPRECSCLSGSRQTRKLFRDLVKTDDT